MPNNLDVLLKRCVKENKNREMVIAEIEDYLSMNFSGEPADLRLLEIILLQWLESIKILDKSIVV